MLKRLMFINYCTQRIGLWDKKDLEDGVSHIFKTQLTFLLTPFIIIPYFIFASNINGAYLLVAIYGSFIWYSPFVNEKIKKIIVLKELVSEYKKINMTKKVFNFMIGILITALSVVFLIFSFSVFNYIE
ncbi:hypothetical protein F7018_07310 [Tenacibaculum aiptasiae]|uniref:Uncharacterized protein n=1 Tax=Tenacibaculum aiptasiae TaxID=426481 RepID=A0A7J5AMS0_9FLAO|nr:hypothetical protein [Tenacibaculum aiptasiae]KAB1158904.1 hypothetical protein F7018_07310 [Tenacibaculum aiptasiae]